MKNDWKSKLTSRKFWLAIVGFVSPLIIARGGSAELAYEITALLHAVKIAVPFARASVIDAVGTVIPVDAVRHLRVHKGHIGAL